MTSQLPPPGPGSDPSNSNRRDPLGFDEILALLVAFSVVGAILWWTMGRKAETWVSERLSPTNRNEQVDSFSSLAPSPNPAVPVQPTPAPVRITPTVNPETLGLETPGAATGLGTGSRAVLPGVVAPVIVSGMASPAPAVVETPAATVSPPPSLPSPPPIAVPSVVPQAVRFPDIPDTYWAAPFINGLGDRGVISGLEGGNFQPDQTITRAQYATLLGNVLQDDRQNPIAFKDVPPTFWGKQAVDEAVKSNFLRGFPDETFQPDQPISKLQILLSLVSGFQLPKSVNADAALQSFQDREQIPEWAKSAVAAATEAGVVVNYPNRDQLDLNQPATRAEVAALLYQALITTGQVQPVQSNYIVRP